MRAIPFMLHRYQEDAASTTGEQGMCIIQAARRRVVAVELVGEERVRESQARLGDATQATLACAGVSSVVSPCMWLRAALKHHNAPHRPVQRLGTR